jgi:hypothetical protein
VKRVEDALELGWKKSRAEPVEYAMNGSCSLTRWTSTEGTNKFLVQRFLAKRSITFGARLFNERGPNFSTSASTSDRAFVAG